MKLRDIPFPKEYGSWGILITSCVIGIGLQHNPARDTLTTLASLAGIAALFATKASIGAAVRRRSAGMLVFTLAYAGAGLALLVPALSRLSSGHILGLAAVPSITVAVYVLSAYLHRERAAVVEYSAMATLTLPVLFFYVTRTDTISMAILSLWFVSFLFFSASIFKVKLLIFGSRSFRIAAVAHVAAACAFMAAFVYTLIIPWTTGLAFLPLLDNLYSALMHRRSRVSLKRVGITELIKGIIFAAVLIATTKTLFS